MNKTKTIPVPRTQRLRVNKKLNNSKNRKDAHAACESDNPSSIPKHAHTTSKQGSQLQTMAQEAYHQNHCLGDRAKTTYALTLNPIKENITDTKTMQTVSN